MWTDPPRLRCGFLHDEELRKELHDEDPRKEAKPKETKQDALKQTTETPKITIEEKSNPRKIIFRKSFNGKASRRLANGRLMLRKKKEKDGRKDPLVESLLSQIKRQKLKHRSFRRNRTGPGGVKRPLPAILNRHKVGPHTIHHSLDQAQ